jgi:hypothetical protein
MGSNLGFTHYEKWPVDDFWVHYAEEYIWIQ